MPPDAKPLHVPPFVLEVCGFYSALMRTAEQARDAEMDEPSLGGSLLWAGDLDERGRALVVAGNIAGAAALSVTADLTAQKQAIREGVVDFLVNSLDEALRILKNEIRKRERVAVCIAADLPSVLREMTERGVHADLAREDVVAAVAEEDLSADRAGIRGEADRGVKRVAWAVDSAPAHWLPKVDALALNCLPETAVLERRWLRLAPRYLGRLAGGVRSVWADDEFTTSFVAKVRRAVEGGEIAAAVTIEVATAGAGESHRIEPGSAE